MQPKQLGVLGGTLIVIGTAIGAGMLALPVATGYGGFFPSIAVLCCSWIFMTITGLLFAELATWLRKEVNLIGMAAATLGKHTKIIVWVLYLFLYYCLTLAYMVGGGNLLPYLGIGGSDTTHTLLFAALFIAIVIIGKRIVDPVNKLLVVGLFVAYLGFIFIGAPLVQYSLLLDRNWSYFPLILPITFTAFGFQGTVPTLAYWMGYNLRKIRKAIVIGTTTTFAIYVIWQLLFFGIVPRHGPHGLEEALRSGLDAVHPLQYFTQNPYILTCARTFAFCAIITSFLGVGIGLVDFVSDGLNIRRQGIQNTFLIACIAFLPPLFFGLLYPHIFLNALSLAGGFGCASLLGVLPIIMSWRAKYVVLQPICNNVLGKKSVLLALLLFVTFEIICEAVNLFW